MTNDEADEVKSMSQNNLESMEGSEFLFNYVHLLY